MAFSGVCVGGPKNGQFYEALSPNFRAPIDKPIVAAIDYNSTACNNTLETVTYVWMECAGEGLWMTPDLTIKDCLQILIQSHRMLHEDR